jgi:hypothetical protein
MHKIYYMSYFIKKLKYLFVLISAFQAYVVGYEVRHHLPFLQIGLHSTP